MENELPLILAVADLAYSGGETFQIYQLALQKKEFKANLQTVPLAEVIQTVEQRKPALVIIGHRPLLDDDDMQERWNRLGKPMGGDLVKALKSNPETHDIPVLMVEAHIHLEEIAKDCGADAYLMVPMHPKGLIETISRLLIPLSRRRFSETVNMAPFV